MFCIDLETSTSRPDLTSPQGPYSDAFGYSDPVIPNITRNWQFALNVEYMSVILAIGKLRQDQKFKASLSLLGSLVPT